VTAESQTNDVRPTVLIVDDDLSALETLGYALRKFGFNALTAATGGEALKIARAARTGTAVFDHRLPDMSGTDLARAFRAEGLTWPFIVVSGFLNTQSTVEAMQLGASEVLDKPITPNDLCDLLARLSIRTRSPLPTGMRWRTAAERLAHLVWRGSLADGGPKTVLEWAEIVSINDSSLRGLCRMQGIRAQDARDLARLLGATRYARAHRCPVAAFLRVDDERTLRHLLARGGLDALSSQGGPLDEFLRRQHFVDACHPVIDALQTLVVAEPAPLPNRQPGG
jgi:FixJ family two-component response regulator